MIKSTTEEKDLPLDWTSIEIPKFLEDRGIRSSHIKQIYFAQKENLTSEDIQNSLHDFSYDLENELVKPFKGVATLFLGVLKG